MTLRTKPRVLRLFLFCFLTLAAALVVTIADAATLPAVGSARDFWVWNLSAQPPAFRKAHAVLRATGARSQIYIEDKLFGHDIQPDFVSRLSWQLETAAPSSAIRTDTGVIGLEEQMFGPLPKKVSSDDRLIVLFADLNSPKDAPYDGFFNAYDQLTDAEAMRKFQQHSNEANLIYVNGFRQSESYTAGVIAHELQHLLGAGSVTAPRESWLSESLGEGAMLLTGYFSDQEHVSRLSAHSGEYSLVTPGRVEYGPQLLFASFLIDTLPGAKGTAIGSLNAIDLPGRGAVEQLVRKLTDVPLNFDAIFSNFVSYVFTQSEGAAALPGAWRHSPGIEVPTIASYYKYRAGSGILQGQLSPYSFVAIDLDQALSPSAIIEVTREPPPAGTSTSCATNASVLWKPVNPKRVAVYAVGCDPDGKPDEVQFRLKILDQPSLLPRNPFRLLP